MKTKLSPYTIASNCTDCNDLICGINELKEYFDMCFRKGKKPALYAAIRYSKLVDKYNKLIK